MGRWFDYILETLDAQNVYVLLFDNSGWVLQHLGITDLLLSLQTFAHMIARLLKLYLRLDVCEGRSEP